MPCAALFCFAWLAATVCSLPAQESRKIERCNRISAPQQHFPQLVFDDIRLDPSSDVPTDVWQSVLTSIRQTDLEAHPGWAEELQQAGVVGTLLDQGYIRATAKVEASDINSDSTQQQVSLAVHIDAGPQYKLSSITFQSSDPSGLLFFSEAELRSLVPLQEGEPLSASRLRLGFSQLRDAYAAQGYADFVPTPEMQFDNANHQIALVLLLDQGRPSRIGTITVRGFSPALESELRQSLRPGDPLNYQLIDDFYKSHQSVLPTDARPEDVEIDKHFTDGVADIVLDFRSCAQLQLEQPAGPPPEPTTGTVLRKKTEP